MGSVATTGGGKWGGAAFAGGVSDGLGATVTTAIFEGAASG